MLLPTGKIYGISGRLFTGLGHLKNSNLFKEENGNKQVKVYELVEVGEMQLIDLINEHSLNQQVKDNSQKEKARQLLEMQQLELYKQLKKKFG